MIIAIIPARAGSKRLPNKNKRLFCGKPLIYWTIDVALQCGFINEILISTDDQDIMKMIGRDYFHYDKVKLIERPKKYAQDDTPIWKVVKHACKNYLREDIIILLQPTSPLRITEDINYSEIMFDGKNLGSVISAYYDKDKSFKLNGAIYIARLQDVITYKGFFRKFMGLYLMPEERSIDINTLEDFKKAEEYMKKVIG